MPTKGDEHVFRGEAGARLAWDGGEPCTGARTRLGTNHGSGSGREVTQELLSGGVVDNESGRVLPAMAPKPGFALK